MLRVLLLNGLLVAGLLAGCVEDEPAAVVAPPPPPPTPEEEAVDWTATVGTGMCYQGSAVVSVSFCGLTGPALTNPGTQASYHPMYEYWEEDGRDLAGGQLELSWVASSVATEGLRITVALWEGCPDECAVNRTLYSTAGVSPLAIHVEPNDLREGMVFSVTVEPAPLTADASASIGQEVHLTGTLLLVEDVDGDPEPEDDEEDEEDDAD